MAVDYSLSIEAFLSICFFFSSLCSLFFFSPISPRLFKISTDSYQTSYCLFIFFSSPLRLRLSSIFHPSSENPIFYFSFKAHSLSMSHFFPLFSFSKTSPLFHAAGRFPCLSIYLFIILFYFK